MKKTNSWVQSPDSCYSSAHGFRFVIYRGDHESAHTYITGPEQMKIDLTGPDSKPETVYFIGIKIIDQRRLMTEVIERQDEFLAEWERIHGTQDKCVFIVVV